jgi:hypothetical protein
MRIAAAGDGIKSGNINDSKSLIWKRPSDNARSTNINQSGKLNPFDFRKLKGKPWAKK